MFQTKVVQKIKTHFVFNNFYPRKHAVYEIMWKNVVERDRPQMAVQGEYKLSEDFVTP